MSLNGRAPDPLALSRMSEALVHRGPDGDGSYAGDGVGLVHRRLSVIDLKTGAQPLYGDNGTALIANAEIYNHIELRKALEADGPFKTASDCEVILRLYARRGLDGFRELRGMYAFALFDPATSTLVLARDPFGIKPLYYIEGPFGFAFASEPQALRAAGLAPAEIVAPPTAELLQLNFTTGSQTILAGVHRVLPGETIVVRGGRIVGRERQAALPAGSPVAISEVEALKDLDSVLSESITLHQRSDVPYGLFLSGGIDSRSILACMARSGPNAVQAYTASFPEVVERDEHTAAARAARTFGARHIRVEVTGKDFWSALPSVVAQLDDPVADAATVPTFLLAREAVKDLKVVLCGEGGDELFAGYSRYGRQARPLWLGGRQRRRKGPFSGRGVLRQDTMEWRDGIVAAEQRCRDGQRSRLQVAQAADCEDFLAHGLLTKLDRTLMGNGVEGRTPLLDRSVAAFGMRLPQRLKLRHGLGKYLVRRWLDAQAPQDDCFSRKKGFTPPYLKWVRDAGERLGPLVAADPAVDAICLPGAVSGLFVSEQEQDLEAAWRLLFFALWHRRHVREQTFDGDVIECLQPN